MDDNNLDNFNSTWCTLCNEGYVNDFASEDYIKMLLVFIEHVCNNFNHNKFKIYDEQYIRTFITG